MNILTSRFNPCLPAISILLMLPWYGLASAAEPVVQNPSADRVARLLEELTNAPAPSGFEGPVRQIVERELQSSGVRISHDGLGLVIGEIPGASDRPRVMVTAHMDEAGLMVQQVREDGFITFKTLGGWFDQALVGQRWTIVTRRGPELGISGVRTVHVSRAEAGNRVWGLDELCIDVGAKSRKGVEAMGIRPGDPVAPWSPFTHLPNNRYAAKAWDDRAGLGVMLEALRQIKEQNLKLGVQLVLVATVQEEIGLRGGQTSTRMVDPDLGISIEAGVAADYPTAKPDQAQERLGAGAGIFLLDSSMIPNLKLRDFVLDVAKEDGIPLQTEVLYGYGEDGAEIQRYATGRPWVNITVPTRYLHSHTGIIDRGDFDHAVRLLVSLLRRLDAAKVKELSSF
jgi:endoglucanase